MKNLTIITFLLLSNFIFSQKGYYANEREIENIENYSTKEIIAETDKKIKIYGTLVTPKSEFNKVLVIISGTGKISQLGHNYLTEYLLENNIAVFKFDKRGVGKSTGNYNDQPKDYTSDFIKILSKLKKSRLTLNKKNWIFRT